MDPSILSSLQNLQLTKEEEEAIPISVSNCPGLLEECSLSLFGRLLVDRQQNQRALKNTLRSAWKMGSDMRIVEVGNNILQFKFSSKFQMEWVERKEIGSKLCTFLEVDRRSWQSDQAKFMRVRVELEIDKPLRRGAYIVSSEEERLWLTFKYKRLPTVCFFCGKLGHDKKHCPAARDWQTACHQYGDWLKAGWNTKMAAKEKNLNNEMGKGNSTCADGNLAGEVQATRGPTELLKSAVTGQGSPSTKAPSETNEKEKTELLNAALAALVGVIFQAKAQGKGKQILGKGNLKKVACAKGKASDDQTLAQMLKFGAKRWRATEASEEETIRASKRLCELVNLGPAIDA
uniref:CCHC-type domain-containing protein n=1 Tax=Quercus lobata TaxID=97700 RepID=A0A7N2QZ38_QUELO